MVDNVNAVTSASVTPQIAGQQAVSTAVTKPEPKPQVTETGEAGKLAAEFVELTASQLDGLVQQLNDFMKEGQRSLSFSVDTSAEEVVISVRDRETEELIRQIPSPEALKLKKHLDGVVGLLFNDRA